MLGPSADDLGITTTEQQSFDLLCSLSGSPRD